MSIEKNNSNQYHTKQEEEKWKKDKVEINPNKNEEEAKTCRWSSSMVQNIKICDSCPRGRIKPPLGHLSAT